MFAQGEIHSCARAQQLTHLCGDDETQVEKRDCIFEQQFLEAIGMSAKWNDHDGRF